MGVRMTKRTGWEKRTGNSEEALLPPKMKVTSVFLLSVIILFTSINCILNEYIYGVTPDPSQSWVDYRATEIKFTEDVLRKTIDFYIATEERGTYFPPTQTAYWSTHGPQLTQNSIKATKDKLAAIQTEVARSQTAQAKLSAQQTAAAKAKTEGAAVQKPPIIHRVEFPSVIPGDGQSHRGRLYFSDPNGDIALYKVEVLYSDPPGWPGIAKNPKDRLISGTWKDGAIWIGFHCTGKNYFQGSLTLVDGKGNVSNPWILSFECR
jgi:hypothetical protein